MPYANKAQAAAMHAKAARGEISESTVKHWDAETKKKGFEKKSALGKWAKKHTNP